jgi:DNA helicase-2/ATP-dependent DNA helicase PcrA
VAKKRKIEFTPSKYQEAIFDFVRYGHGNAVVEAAAGSGKSWTLTKCVELIDNDKSILITAFNRDIVNELKKKTKGNDNVAAMTMHSLGLQMLQRNFSDERLELDEFKYRTFINTNLKDLSAINIFSLPKHELARYRENVYKLVDFGRYYTCETVKDLEMIEERYGIETIADEKEIAVNVMLWGREDLSTIDYTDMIYLPNILMCKPIGLKFDWIMVDEAQDLSVAQRVILLKCVKINTRILFVGDSSQSLYSFSGADPESFKKILELPNTISLPLSISYRCADAIVENAQTIEPKIEKNSDGRHGEIKRECRLEEVQDGDMILCRNNAPLMKVYVEFLRMGRKAFIRGKDIGLNLKNTVKRTCEEMLNTDLKRNGVFVKLYASLFDSINELIAKSNITYADAIESSIIANKIDIIKALEILSEGLTTSDELIDRINNIFSDKKKNEGVSLSTIHKAKGLEAENVYIVCESLMPSKQAKKAWEREQERNLIYVAYTRSKNKLGFIAEDEFETFNETTSDKIANLQKTELLVNNVLGRTTKKVDTNNPYIAREIIKNATKITERPNKTKILTLSDRKQTPNPMSGLFNRRKSFIVRK